MGINPSEIAALMAAHSIGTDDVCSNTGHRRRYFSIPQMPEEDDDASGTNETAMPFDSTVTLFDSQFFIETRLDEVLPGAARLQSDIALALDNRTSCFWQSFIGDETLMQVSFVSAFRKLSTVAQPLADLVDCSEVSLLVLFHIFLNMLTVVNSSGATTS